jgi:formylglycine-generating enzyme required for sulfatase activity
MADNGYEWVSDWYDPDYYNQSPAVDPRGPERPVFKDKLGHETKVLRGQSFADPYWGGGVNVFRTAMDPLGRRNKRGSVFIGDNTMRCVVNSPEPITAGSPPK